jgi:hypothetical protein
VLASSRRRLSRDGVRASAVLRSVIDTPADRRDQPDADSRAWTGRRPSLASSASTTPPTRGNCEQDAVEAALALFERHDPTALAEAARLIEAHCQLTGQAFDRLAEAFDRSSHSREMSSNQDRAAAPAAARRPGPTKRGSLHQTTARARR